MNRAALISAAARLGVALDATQCGQLESYVALLERWNGAFNLVSRADVGRLWTRHVLDSLSALPLIRRSLAPGGRPGGLSALDVGTGAGFPGIPLAIGEPGIRWTLLDRNARKIRFLDQVVQAVGLANVTTVCRNLRPGDPDARALTADLIVSRAVDEPGALAALVGDLLAPGGVLLLLSRVDGGGRDEGATLVAGERIGGGLRIERTEHVEIPGLDRSHELTIIRHA